MFFSKTSLRSGFTRIIFLYSLNDFDKSIKCDLKELKVSHHLWGSTGDWLGGGKDA